MKFSLEKFEWDSGNIHKSFYKHDVAPEECEQVFANAPLLVSDDVKHSRHEPRYQALGKTNEARLLHVVFTILGTSIRIISARSMSRKERAIYEEEI